MPCYEVSGEHDLMTSTYVKTSLKVMNHFFKIFYFILFFYVINFSLVKR